MKRVVLESPFAGDIAQNMFYLRRAMAHCISKGEAPFASHGLYTQPGVLNDDIPGERELGIQAGFAWGKEADYVVVYTDLGITPGMKKGIAFYETQGLPIHYRKIL